MNSKIIRTDTFAGGGITDAEKKKMEAHAKLWTDRAFRTSPIEPDKIVPAIEGIYAAAGLSKPKVIIVPSPLVMAFAHGAASSILANSSHATHNATDTATDTATRAATVTATDDATDNATYDATRNATRTATHAATRAATSIATRNATRAATNNATVTATDDAAWNATYKATRIATVESGAMQACFEMAGEGGLIVAKGWHRAYQGGNMWAWSEAFMTAGRDILNLKLPVHEKYAPWEQAAIHGGFRVMHEQYCMVCDFPEVLKVDENNDPHCEDGPSHRWRDGWSLYYWHGIAVPQEWIEDKESLTPEAVLACADVEVRAAGFDIIGPHKMLDSLRHEIVDSDPDPERGDLIRVWLKGLPDPALYLKFECPRNGPMMEVVDGERLRKLSLLEAHAQHANIPAKLFTYPEQRS